MKNTVIKIMIILSTATLLFAVGCDDTDTEPVNTTSPSEQNASEKGNEEPFADSIVQITIPEGADYTAEDIIALRDKVNNKETLTSEEMALYEQAEQDGIPIKIDGSTAQENSGTTQPSVQASTTPLAGWPEQMSKDNIPSPNAGNVVATNQIETDGEVTAHRAIISRMENEHYDDFIERLRTAGWESYAYTCNTFGENYDNLAGGMDPAPTGYMYRYFEDESGKCMRIAVGLDDNLEQEVIVTVLHTGK